MDQGWLTPHQPRTTLTGNHRPLSYAIAFTMRSGSNLLCDYLRIAGAGSPTEYFQRPYAARHKELFQEAGLAPDDTMGFLSRLVAITTANDVFGFKVSWEQKNALLADIHAKRPRIAKLEDAFPGLVWIHLRRRDKAAQAVSLYKSAITKKWTSLDAGIHESEDVTYSYDRILQCFSTMLIEERLWTDYFSSARIDPLCLWYEDLVADPVSVVNVTLDHLRSMGARKLTSSATSQTLKSSLRKQGDSRSEIFRLRFLDDLAHIGVERHWQGREDQPLKPSSYRFALARPTFREWSLVEPTEPNIPATPNRTAA